MMSYKRYRRGYEEEEFGALVRHSSLVHDLFKLRWSVGAQREIVDRDGPVDGECASDGIDSPQLLLLL